MKRQYFNFAIALVLLLNNNLYAQEKDIKPRAPEQSSDLESNIPSQVDVKKLPDFPAQVGKGASAHKLSATTGVIPVNTRLRLSVDSFVDAKMSKVGDYFKAKVLEDFYIPTNPPQLIVPKGSWVRGRISFIKRPNIISRAGKIGLHLYQLVTPQGESTVLDAELDVQQGIVNSDGLLDPMTGFKTKAIKPTQMLLESEPGRVISVITLGTPVIGTLVSGSLIALCSQGDNISLNQGQELQILLKKDLQLSVN